MQSIAGLNIGTQAQPQAQPEAAAMQEQQAQPEAAPQEQERVEGTTLGDEVYPDSAMAPGASLYEAARAHAVTRTNGKAWSELAPETQVRWALLAREIGLGAS